MEVNWVHYIKQEKTGPKLLSTLSFFRVPEMAIKMGASIVVLLATIEATLARIGGFFETDLLSKKEVKIITEYSQSL